MVDRGTKTHKLTNEKIRSLSISLGERNSKITLYLWGNYEFKSPTLAAPTARRCRDRRDIGRRIITLFKYRSTFPGSSPMCKWCFIDYHARVLLLGSYGNKATIAANIGKNPCDSNTPHLVLGNPYVQRHSSLPIDHVRIILRAFTSSGDGLAPPGEETDTWRTPVKFRGNFAIMFRSFIDERPDFLPHVA